MCALNRSNPRLIKLNNEQEAMQDDEFVIVNADVNVNG